MARTTTCDVCGATMPSTVEGWGSWYFLQGPTPEMGTRDFCSRECLVRWVEAL
jgi:hypothetical protein